MEALFDCTLDMLNKDLEEFPEHRLNFFRMLQSFTTHCFPCMSRYTSTYFISLVAFLSIPSERFKLFVDAVVWAFKHTMRNVAEIGSYWGDLVTLTVLPLSGLNVLFTLLQKFSICTTAAEFFKLYFLNLMQHIFAVVTDTSHTASRLSCALAQSIVFYLCCRSYNACNYLGFHVSAGRGG